MTVFRLLGFLLIFLTLPGLMAAGPGPAHAEDVLPDGCLGNLTDDQVIVYYFHRKFRCGSCEVIESTLQRALETYYGPHFTNGRLAMCVVNIDDPANRHYLEQFQLLSTSLVIVKKSKGSVARFKHIDSIWEISEDPDAISHILQTEISRYLTEG
ncbi:MAG: nitrophenyl compound nitroreductase subunit ArsF family protein [bacterium]|nr:nitrophenyl compound nitroreductase subunit ArsF family protein [bacterium]MDT8395541.1 nitrophenyl compound nitroreductase subunit ArsF family protein [bacterium]